MKTINRQLEEQRKVLVQLEEEQEVLEQKISALRPGNDSDYLDELARLLGMAKQDEQVLMVIQKSEGTH